MSDRELFSSKERDIESMLVALKYDTCDAAETCQPCKGIRLESISTIERLQRQKFNLLVALSRKQARIDALMLEFCPGEMSAEQRAEWAEHQQPSHEPPAALVAFKNFHRLLCERFDYCHDEKDWQRDQLSLIEWIAKRTAQPPGTDAADAARYRWLREKHEFPPYQLQGIPWPVHVVLEHSMPTMQPCWGQTLDAMVDAQMASSLTKCEGRSDG